MMHQVVKSLTCGRKDIGKISPECFLNIILQNFQDSISNLLLKHIPNLLLSVKAI